MQRSGSVIEAVVIEANRGVSEKAATQQFRRDRNARGTAQLSTSDVLSGTVVCVTSYGLFVDVGLADGLVQRSRCRSSARAPTRGSDT
jgi:ribosomal protein S1